MSFLDTRNALVTQLLTLISVDDTALENDVFKDTNKDVWYAMAFIPASVESTGKTLASSDEDRGIFQVSVMVQINSGNKDLLQLEAVDALRSGFLYSTSLVYNGQQVDILKFEPNEGSEDDAWYKRDISINYLTFSERI
jgi:hypothetical protein